MQGCIIENVPHVHRHFDLLIKYGLDNFLKIQEDVSEEATSGRCFDNGLEMFLTVSVTFNDINKLSLPSVLRVVIHVQLVERALEVTRGSKD